MRSRLTCHVALVALIAATAAAGISRWTMHTSAVTPPYAWTTASMTLTEAFTFEPSTISVLAGTEVTVTLVNSSSFIHRFKIHALREDSGEIRGGDTATVTLTAPAGDYDFYCAVPGHKELGMVGVLHVVAGSSDRMPTIMPVDGDVATEPLGTVATPVGATPIDADPEANRVADLETRVAQLETMVAGTPMPSWVASAVAASPIAASTVVASAVTASPTPTSVPATSAPVPTLAVPMWTPTADPPTPSAPPTIAASIPPVSSGTGTRQSPASLGQTVTLDGLSVTLVSVTALPPGTFYTEPSAGAVFLAVDLRIENGAGGPVPYGRDHVSLKDIVEGFEFTDTTFTGLGSSALRDGDLATGDFVRGVVIVQANADSTQLLVRYSVEPYGRGEQLYWDVVLP